MRHCKSRVLTWGLLIGVGTGLLSSCSAPSLLITPVTSRRNLVETTLARDSALAGDKVLLIDISGLLINAHAPQWFGEGEHPVSLLVEQLEKARNDPAVKAVVLRINSPGGTVTASELMYDEIRHFRNRTGRPVIAVMMDVAASGGYYVACACDEIVAQPSSVTGSIGVVMQMFDLSGTMQKIGVKSDAITSGVHKDTGSPFRTMRPEERELFQQIINEMYDRFVHVVIQGRPKLDEATIRSLADGRVYTAGQALQVGLIDRIATLRDTIEATKHRIPASSIRLVAYQRPLDYRPNYYARIPSAPAGDVNLLNIDIHPPWQSSTPQFLYLWQPGL